MSKLSNKVAVVTGASKGIGAEIARELAAAGASVVVNDATSRHDADKLDGGESNEGAQVSSRFSKSLARRRLHANQEKVRSVTRRMSVALPPIDPTVLLCPHRRSPSW